MKVLLTGFNARSTGSERLKMNYVSTSGALYNGLRALSYDVDFRPPVFGEDLSAYDLAIVCVACLDRRGTYHHEKCAWVLDQMYDRVVLYFDDWATNNFARDTDYRLNKILAKYLKWRAWEEKPKREIDLMIEQLNLIIGDRCPWPILTPTFSWGDHSKILEAGGRRLNPVAQLTLDPTTLATLPATPKLVNNKERAWVYATLQKHDSWLKKQQMGWPVYRFGNQRAGDPWVDEDEIVKLYAKTWGVCCPEYAMSGSGWWRVRYYYAAMTNSIVLTTGADARALGPVFEHSASDYESATTKKLKEVAEAQRRRIVETMDDYATALGKLKTLAERYGRRA